MNAGLEGKVYPALPFEVEPERARRFAAVVGGDPDRVPPTYPTVAEVAAGFARVVVDPDLGLDFSRVVHAEQSYEWHRPLVAGERLEAVSTIESIRERAGSGFLTIRTELRDATGGTAVVARATLLERGSAT